MLVSCAAACRFGLPGPATNGDGGGGSDAPADTPPDLPGPPGDRDGDGVLDAVDKCPDVADPLQRDFDSDGFGDACDGCPPFASATNDDTDGDGVGDACDPHPATAGDKIALWLGNYDEDAARVAGFIKGGTWTVSGGALHTMNGNTSSFLRAPPDVARAVQFTRVTLDDFTSTSAAVAVENGVVVTSGNLVQFYQCALFRQPAEVRAKSVVGDTTIDDQGVAWTGAVANGTQVDMTVQFANDFRCTVAAPQTMVSSLKDASTGGGAELFVQRADASFAYWFVIDAGP